jgi:hypothetical protein
MDTTATVRQRGVGQTGLVDAVRTGTVQAFQAENHSELNELENSVTRLETALGSVMSAGPPAGNRAKEVDNVGGSCEVAQSAASAALRTAGLRERIDAVMSRLQIA